MRRSEETSVRCRKAVHDLPALLVMLIAVALIYRRLVAGRVLAGGDLHVYFFPYWTAVVRAVQAHRLPLWNSYLFAGAPLAANSQVGLFYPLNWPFWIFTFPSPADVARALHLSVLLHLGMASISVYALGRRSGLRAWPAALAGIIYAGSGFVGVHVEHLNQLQALAWLPLLFLPAKSWRITLMGHLVQLPHPLSVMALAMILLAGHTQMAFIGAIGVVVWQGVRRLEWAVLPSAAGLWWRRFARSVWPWIVGLTPFAVAGVMAAVQLLPTLQLTGLSGRSTGLDWREAVSFSVGPRAFPAALLPPYLAALMLPEGVAYIGIGGLLFAALGIRRAARSVSQRHGGLAVAWVVLAGLGVFMALGGYNPLYLAAVRLRVPGFVHFRAPARFLSLYVLGISLVAGAGLDDVAHYLLASSLRWARGVVAVVGFVAVGFELLLAGEYLPHADATAARAYSDLRPATAHLVAAAQAADAAGVAPERFLSISQMLFEIGDKAEVELVYGDALSPDALWAYMVSSKQREILTPNLPLAFGVPAADGYDGGLLPMRHYIAFSELLIPGGTLDGRLRENLSTVPDERWLDLLGVRYVLTDKTGDVWVDDILYDLQFQPVLQEDKLLSVAWLPESFPSNAIGVLYEGGEVAVSVILADGRQFTRMLPFLSVADGTHWVRWPEAAPVIGLKFEAMGKAVRLMGASLVDERSRAFYPLVLSDGYRLVHSGDVKIYETVSRPARLRLLTECWAADSLVEALAQMEDPSFDPTETVVIDTVEGRCPVKLAGPSGEGRLSAGSVSLVQYDDREVTLDVHTDAPAYLLLTDAWYPGWQVWLEDRDDSGADAVQIPLLRADIMFRAAVIEPGSWRVTFRYVPYILLYGAVASLLGVMAFVAYVWWGVKRATC